MKNLFALSKLAKVIPRKGLAIIKRHKILAACGVVVFVGAFLLVSSLLASPAEKVPSANSNKKPTTPQQKTSEVAGAATTTQPSANTGSADTPSSSHQTQPQPNAKSRVKATLVVNPSSVALPLTGGLTIGISLSDGGSFGRPSVSSVNGVSAIVLSGGGDKKTSWKIIVSNTDVNSYFGQATLSISTPEGYTGTLLVKDEAPAKPYFTSLHGQMVRNVGVDAITYTLNFSIVPNASFGNPTIDMSINGDMPCVNRDTSKTVQYNGQNSYSLDCVVPRRHVTYPPGTTPPPPSSTVITVKIHARTAMGVPIQAGIDTLNFYTPSPYDD